jgi:hypothetical protein
MLLHTAPIDYRFIDKALIECILDLGRELPGIQIDQLDYKRRDCFHIFPFDRVA